MGFEIPIDVDYFEHPKALKMIALLGKNSDIYPLRLWAWCAKFARKGVIDGGPGQVEEACKWRGKPGELHQALIDAKVLEADGKTVHDWMDHAGRLVKQYEAKKKNQRKKYANSSGILPEEFRPSSTLIEEKRIEENRTEEKKAKNHDSIVSDLAQKAAFNEGYGTDPKRIAIWFAHLSDLRKTISIEIIEKALDEPGRQSSQPPWDFKKQIEAENGIFANGKAKKNGTISPEEMGNYFRTKQNDRN